MYLGLFNEINILCANCLLESAVMGFLVEMY